MTAIHVFTILKFSITRNGFLEAAGLPENMSYVTRRLQPLTFIDFVG